MTPASDAPPSTSGTPPAEGVTSLYKYTSFDTARIVLASGRLRWTTPPLLNDPYDLSFDLQLEVEPQRVRELAIDLLWSDWLDDGTPAPQVLFEAWKQMTKAERPDLDRAEFESVVGPIVSASIRRAESTADMNAELQSYLQRAKLLCLSETPGSMLMWSHYARQHYGAVLRFTREGASNAFGTARPVRYVEKMPRFGDSAALAGMITGRLQNPKTLSDSQIYSKAADWSYEREWRMQLGFGRDRQAPFEDLPFGPEELTGVVMGCRMSGPNRTELARLARQLNPEVSLLCARPSSRDFAMLIEPWDAS